MCPWNSRNFLERISEPEPSLVVSSSVLSGLRNEAQPQRLNIMRQLCLALASLALLAGTALAQPKDGAKVKVYDFSGDTIEGDLVKPEGSTVDARDFAKHSSLITIRKNFIPEIIKSAQDL
jgi:hypothetical protein